MNNQIASTISNYVLGRIDVGNTVADWLLSTTKYNYLMQAATHVPRVRGASSKATAVFWLEPDESGWLTTGALRAAPFDVTGTAVGTRLAGLMMEPIGGSTSLMELLFGRPALVVDALNLLFPKNKNLGQELVIAWQKRISTSLPVELDSVVKQVYWRLDDDSYHLLAVMPATVLMNELTQRAWNLITSAENKTANKARKSGDKSLDDYIWLTMVSRHVGGSKPQNVSVLTNRLQGRFLKLIALPPKNMTAPYCERLMKRETILPALGTFCDMPLLLRRMAAFIAKDLPATAATRRQRELIEDGLERAIIGFAISIQNLMPDGWTRHPDCTLPLWQCIWLDPGRLNRADTDVCHGTDPVTPEDTDVELMAITGEWQQVLADQLAEWIEQYLVAGGVDAGDNTAHWSRRFKKALECSPWKKSTQPKGGIRYAG